MKLLILFSSILLYSCSSATNKSNELPMLSPFNYSSDEIEFADVIDTVIYIQLDTAITLAGLADVSFTENCLVGYSKCGILKYDLSGRFLGKIGQLGKGPEEYHSFYKMAVDKKNEIVYVYMKPDILLSYTFSGHFLNRIHIQLPEHVKDYAPSLISVQNGLLFFYYSENQGLVGYKPVYWVVLRKDGSMVKCREGYYDKFREDEGVIYVNYCTSVNDTTMLYWNYYNDTIFHVGPSQEKPAYLWEKGSFRLLETDKLRNITEDRIRCSQMIETKRFLLLSWKFMNRRASTYYILHDKRKGISYKLKDDMLYDKRGSLSMRFNTYDYVRLGEHDYILTHTKSAEVANIPGAIPWGIDPDDLEGNPVMVMIRLKD